MDRSTLNITPVSSLAQFDCNRVISSNYISAAVARNDCWTTDETAEETYHKTKKSPSSHSDFVLTWKSLTVIHIQQRFSKKEGREGGKEGSPDSFTSLSFSLSLRLLHVLQIFCISVSSRWQVKLRTGTVISISSLHILRRHSLLHLHTEACTHTHDSYADIPTTASD